MLLEKIKDLTKSLFAKRIHFLCMNRMILIKFNFRFCLFIFNGYARSLFKINNYDCILHSKYSFVYII